MKNLISLLFVLFLLIADLYPQDTIIDLNRAQYNTANMVSSERLLDVTSFPCSCPCSTMVKSAIIYQAQGDNELQLVGGYVKTGQSGLTCQRIELNIAAFNNQTIPSLSIQFEPSSDNCFNDKFWLYRDNGDGTATYSDNFYPQSTPPESGILIINPPIESCSSRKVIFYICSTVMNNCEGDNYSVSVRVNGQVPYCQKDMTWHFDFLLGLMYNKFIIDLQNLEISNSTNTTYQMIDIFSNQVFTGKIKRLNEIESIKKNIKNRNGFFIFNIFDENKIIYQEKFINSN